MVLFAACFVVLGFHAIATTDDFWHAHIILNIRPSILAPFAWTYSHYLNWTGRVFVSFMQGVFVTKPLNTDIVSTINALLFLGAIFFYNQNILKKMASTSLEKRDLNIYLLLIVFFNCYFVLGESIFWVAAVYLWPLIIFILCSYLLNLLAEKNFSQKEKLVLLFLCFLFGNSIELMFVPGLMLLVQAIKHSRESRKFHGALIGAFLLGTALLVCSPGNFKHLHAAENDLSFNILNQLSNAKMVFAKPAYLMNWNLILSMLVAICVPTLQGLTRETAKKNFLFFLAIAIGSLLPLIPLHGFSADRTYVYFCIFLSYSLFWGTQYIKIHFSVPLVFSRAVHLSAFILSIIFLVLNIVD